MNLMRMVIGVALLPATLAAQETPTERAAAAPVVAKLATLEQSLDVPALVARLTGTDAARDRVAARAKQLMEQELLAMSDDITRHPEHGFEEHRSVRILTDWLRAHGFSVDTGVAGLSTAFVARYTRGTPGPNLGVIVEYDALRGTTGDFHGDQHSAQGPVGLAVAAAVAEFLTRIEDAGDRHRVWHAGRGDDAAGRQDRDVRGRDLQGRRHHRAVALHHRHVAARRPASAPAASTSTGSTTSSPAPRRTR